MLNRPIRRAVLGLGLASTLALSACGADEGSDPFSSGGGDGGGSGDTIVVGSANFPESELLMEMYAQALEAQDVSVETKPNIGAREVYMQAFDDGDITLLPEYNGALLTYLSDGKADPKITSPDDVYQELQKVLPEGAETLPQSDAEDKDTLTVTSETAEKYDLKAIPDLKPVAGEMTVAAGPEFRERFQGLVGLKEVYGVDFGQFKPLDAGGPLTVGALEDGTADVANIFSTNPVISEKGWVTLEDPENLYTSQNVVPLIKSDAVTPEVEDALNGVSEALTTENLTEALAKVQEDKQDPAVVAKDFLSEQGLD